MIKPSIVLMILSFGLSSFGQENSVVISLPHSGAIYTGYANLIEISFTQMKQEEISLECATCDTIYQFNNLEKNQWLLSVKHNNNTTITIIARNKDGIEIGRKEFQLLAPPAPEVILDNVNAKSLILGIPQSIILKIPEGIPVSIGYIVTSWIIEINGKSFSGNGSKLTDDVKNQINVDRSGFLILTIRYHNSIEIVETQEIFQFRIK